MGVIKTKGLILSQYNLNDNDRMVTLLTPNLGKIGCAAIGSRKGKSPLMAGTQFLCFGDFIVYKGISSYRINSCEPIEKGRPLFPIYHWGIECDFLVGFCWKTIFPCVRISHDDDWINCNLRT